MKVGQLRDNRFSGTICCSMLGYTKSDFVVILILNSTVNNFDKVVTTTIVLDICIRLFVALVSWLLFMVRLNSQPICSQIRQVQPY